MNIVLRIRNTAVITAALVIYHEFCPKRRPFLNFMYINSSACDHLCRIAFL